MTRPATIYRGERFGDYVVVYHMGKGRWLIRCVYCRSERKTTAYWLKHHPFACKCQQSPLSLQEWKVARLLADGLTCAQIGERLTIAKSTVNRHVANIYAKLDIHDRRSLVAWLDAYTIT